MKDQLKKFAEENRTEFEVYKLDLDEAWSSIESQLDNQVDKSIPFPWKNISKIAAILLLIMSITFGYYLNSQRIDMDKYGIALQEVSSELADTEAFYAMQIDEKLNLIKLEKGSVDPDLVNQMKIFEEDYHLLKKDLKDNADTEEVINAMIEHYRLKLEMLEKILYEIEKDNINKDYDEAQAI